METQVLPYITHHTLYVYTMSISNNEVQCTNSCTSNSAKVV